MIKEVISKKTVPYVAPTTREQSAIVSAFERVLGCKNIRACDSGKNIKTVALIGGSGKEFLFDAAFSGADAFVTSEIPHHLYEEAKNLGISVYDCGHYYTENPVCARLFELAAETGVIPTITFSNRIKTV